MFTRKYYLLIVLIGFAIFYFSITTPTSQSEDFFMTQRQKMVDEQIIRRGVDDESVIKAMRKVERHLFVPQHERLMAYGDHPLPIGFDQTISQPYIVAYMTQMARLTPEDKVLEIGTGSGYQAAILAEIVKEVYTIEIVKGLAETAEQRLKDMGYKNIFVKLGDGYEGWPEHAPYDAIIVTAAPDEVPQKLVEQLSVGGRMVVPLGSVFQELYLITKTKEGIIKKSLIPVRFVPMVEDNSSKN